MFYLLFLFGVEEAAFLGETAVEVEVEEEVVFLGELELDRFDTEAGATSCTEDSFRLEWGEWGEELSVLSEEYRLRQ